MKYIIVKNLDYNVEEVKCFDSLKEAEKALTEIQNTYQEEEILGLDDDYLQAEDKYGSIITYQIIGVNC